MMDFSRQSGGTVNGRTLAQVEAQRAWFARLERENYLWKLRRHA